MGGVYQYGLLSGREYTVGRKDCHILLSMDQSISRNHAKLTVSSPPSSGVATPNAATPTVTLRDLSKFGTHVNGCKVERTRAEVTAVELRHGDEVKFGGTPSSTVFRLQWSPVAVCCSGMKPSEQNRVRQLVETLGGAVVPQWTKECLCLVMTKLTVTQKVITALSCCKPVVTADWLEELVKCCEQQKQLPDPASHLPPITDHNVEKDPAIFYPDPARRAVFKDKVLCFLSKQQYASYELCVTTSGGDCRYLEPQSVRPSALTLNPSCMVVSVEENVSRKMRREDREWMEEVFQRVEREGFRKIHETEIVRAVLHRSTVEYCNPASQPVPVGVPLAPPSLSQMSYPSTQQSQPSFTDTQLHSQSSLLAERRDANTTCSFPSQAEPVKEEREGKESMFRPPPAPRTTLAPSQAGVPSTGAPIRQTLDLSSCGGDESLERRVLAPSSLPADGSFDEGCKLASASFVAGLFPQRRKGKRSFGEVDESTESVPTSRAKKTVNQSNGANGGELDSDVSGTDDPNSCNAQEPVRAAMMQLPTGDVDVFGFRKRKSSWSPQDETQDFRRKFLKTSNTDEVGVTNSSARDISLSQDSASGARLSTPVNSQLSRNTATGTRRPRRFAPQPALPSQQFISTRKSSVAFYHPPILTEGNSSRILSCSYREVLQDVTASQLTSGSYNEEESDGERVEEEDGSLPVLDCSVLPLVKRQEDEVEPRPEEVGGSSSVRNYKQFRKVQCTQGGQLPGAIGAINLEVYRKPEDRSVLARLQGCFNESEPEEQESCSEEDNPFVFQTKRK